MYILCIYTDKTDCRYKLTHRFRFHIYAKKKPAFLANKFRVFCRVFPRTDDFYTNFFRCFSSSWISICVYHFQHPRGNKKTHLSSRAFFYPNRKICKRIYQHVEFTENLPLGANLAGTDGHEGKNQQVSDAGGNTRK